MQTDTQTNKQNQTNRQNKETNGELDKRWVKRKREKVQLMWKIDKYTQKKWSKNMLFFVQILFDSLTFVSKDVAKILKNIVYIVVLKKILDIIWNYTQYIIPMIKLFNSVCNTIKRLKIIVCSF